MNVIGIVLLEFAGLLLFLWGCIHKEKLVNFENKIIEKFKNAIKNGLKVH